MPKYIFGTFHFPEGEKKVIIESVEDTKEFDDDADADEYMCDMGYDSYCEANLLDWTYEYLDADAEADPKKN